MPITITCQYCGKSFHIRPARLKTAKYCSYKCLNRANALKYPPWNKGKKTGIVPKSCFKKGQIPWNKGVSWDKKTKKKMSLSHTGKTGNECSNWKGGRIKSIKGYIFIYNPEHPRALRKYVPEQVLVVEKVLGRFLDRDETVHHIDFNLSNNIPKNLFIFENHSEHMRFHLAVRYGKLSKTWLKSNLK